MSNRTFTPAEAAEIAKAFFQKRVTELAKSLDVIKSRELAKAVITPHKHGGGTAASGGVEDVAPGKLNPPGKLDAIKGEVEASDRGEETSGEISAADKKCAKCSLMKDMCKCMSKDELVSNTSERHQVVHPESVLPEDKKSKVINKKNLGAGGVIKEGKGKSVSDELSKAQKKLDKAGMPPTAKPPSGTNMATKVPTSKPAAMPKMPATPGAMKGEAFSSGTTDMGQSGGGSEMTQMEKGVMSDIAHKESAAQGAPAPKAAPVKLNTKATIAGQGGQAAAVGRDAFYSAASQGAFQPAGKTPASAQIPLGRTPAKKPATMLPSTTGPTMKKPGIFGRLLGKSEDLEKAVTTAIPKLKPAAAGMFTVGGQNVSNTAPTAPSTAQTDATNPGIAPKTSLASMRVAATKPSMPAISAKPTAPVTTSIPKLKPAAAGMHTVGGATATGATNTHVPSEPTVGAKPSNLKPGNK
jgi:hypothetical protein